MNEGVQCALLQQEALVKWEKTALANRMAKTHQRSGGVTDAKNDSDNFLLQQPKQYLKFLVLDSPFTSLKEVVLEAANHIDVLGIYNTCFVCSFEFMNQR